MPDKLASEAAARFARRVFLAAGLFGLAVLLPMYAQEERIGAKSPPPITHPEYFYGFVGVALAWQVAFLLIARDPVRLRPVMLAGVLEKASFGIAAIVLFAQRRIEPLMLAAGIGDLVWGALFIAAYVATTPSLKNASPPRPGRTT